MRRRHDNERERRITRLTLMMIGCLILGFNIVAFRFDAGRPHYQPMIAKPFPPAAALVSIPRMERPSRSTDPLAGTDDGDGQWMMDYSRALREGDPTAIALIESATDRAEVVALGNRIEDYREQRLQECAHAIEAGDSSVIAQIADASERAHVLAAAHKIEDYRASYPSGPLPGYLESELSDLGLGAALESVPAIQADAWRTLQPADSPEKLRRESQVSSSIFPTDARVVPPEPTAAEQPAPGAASGGRSPLEPPIVGQPAAIVVTRSAAARTAGGTPFGSRAPAIIGSPP